ncbi:AMP-binding protein [Nocardioides daeguensis]|uniref:Long-chain fatty acid--CoA ligase n=1 Tax=Nocardioides daeguensis TaxID=908359 RepID=A0ABP6UX78_9ACTN|nr:AMP-binding protein [Nocardioides daeguensis]MBV6726968.1 AMP-binding protein [Nocardioides daeguensis]MCR1771628.1 AMP-binding protein [Nocardioides daeguensis]
MPLPDASAVPDVAALVASAAAEHPERLAVVEAGGRGLTWAELEDEVARVATGLGRAGVLAGNRVMLVLGNRLEFVTGYLGVLRAQAVAVPVNPGSTPTELAAMLVDCGARLVLADGGTVAAARDAVSRAEVAAAAHDEHRPAPRIVLVGAEAGAAGPTEITYADLRAEPAVPVPPLQDPEKLAVLLYTSGTSGRPRAAMLTHRALLANVDQVAAVHPPMIHSDDVVLGVLPLFHVYGLGAVLGGVIRHRAKLVLAERFDPEGTLDLVEDEACSVVPVAPPVFAAWRGVDALAERLGPVRMILSGSAPLAAETVEEFGALARVPIHQGYGLTEASPVVTSTLRSAEAKPGSVGAALDGIDIRLVDEEGVPLDDAAVDDPGEIQIRGRNLFSGYWPDGQDGPAADGWWSTGDVGFLDADGDLFLVDRVKELVIVSGFNVYPTEVEAVLEGVAGVRQAAVLGVPDERTGEAVIAYVVPESGEVTGAGADAVVSAVRAAAAEQLAPYKRPLRVEVVTALPRTVTGKIRKGVLRGAERRKALGILE